MNLRINRLVFERWANIHQMDFFLVPRKKHPHLRRRNCGKTNPIFFAFGMGVISLFKTHVNHLKWSKGEPFAFISFFIPVSFLRKEKESGGFRQIYFLCSGFHFWLKNDARKWKRRITSKQFHRTEGNWNNETWNTSFSTRYQMIFVWALNA